MPTPLDDLRDLTTWFGQPPGSDRFLIDRATMERWMHELAASSDRMAMHPIGQSTEGREMWLIAVSSTDTIRGLDGARERRQALADRTLLLDPARADGCAAGDKPVLLITAAIHATEVGGVQLMPELLLDLAMSADPRILDILDRVIVLIVPTLNPDGMDLVHDWYMQTLGTAWEGTTPPQLYHRYAGHDNNRDWYTHVLAETRNVIEHVHRPWRPTILLDLHQMGEKAPRYVLPPFVDPVEPHVHPLVTALTNSVGSALVTAHQRRGHPGVASGVMFDSYSPTRSYVTYHGGVRILAEAASGRIATPVTLVPAQLDTRRGFDQRRHSIHNTRPWAGGAWRLRDIMDYHLVTIHGLLDHVAAYADALVRDQWTALADEVRDDHGPVYTISPIRQQIDPRAATDLVGMLQRGDVELRYVEEAGQVVPKGSILVDSRQPFGAYARALLDLTPYPEVASTPYDVTSHCVPIHMGVETRRWPADTDVHTRPLRDADLRVFPRPTAADAHRGRWLAIDHRSHASIRIAAEVAGNGGAIRRLTRPHFDGGRLLEPGTWLIAGEHALDGMSRTSREMVRSWPVSPIEHGTVRQRLPRIGLYVPWREDAIDAGWLRLMLDHAALPYAIIRNEDVRGGHLDGLDVLLLGDQEPEALIHGNDGSTYPAPYAGGIGTEGLETLGCWVARGGTLVAIDGAARSIASPLGIPVRFPLAAMGTDLYAAPGSVVQVVPAPNHPLMLGINEPFPVMLNGNNALAHRKAPDDEAFAATFAEPHPLISGWMRGQERLAGLGAIADSEVDEGRVVSFAFRPHFRTQMLASYGPLVNAIMRPGMAPAEGDA